MNKFSLGSRHYLLAIFSLAISSIPRVWVFLNYPFAFGNDSATYIHLANSLRNNLGFAKYNGTRTPGYPLFILMTGNGEFTYFTQLVLGLLTTLLIYILVWRLTKNAWLAFFLSLAHSLNLGQLFFEASLLSEASSTFLFFLTLLLAQEIYCQLSKSAANDNSRLVGISILFGVVSLLMAAIRPLFLPVPFIAVLFIFWQNKFTVLGRSISTSLLMILPLTIATLTWVSYIYLKFHILGLDAMGGYHLVNHTSSFFEKAPAEYQQITDIFLKYREIKVAETGSAVNTIWDAIPELMKTTKLNYYSLGRTMGTISSTLIKENPREYWTNIAKGWFWFWKVGVFWLPNSIADATTRLVLNTLLQAERAALIAINAFFVFIPIVTFSAKVRKIFTKEVFLLFGTTLIWVTSVLQTFAEHGDNPRFLAPAQSLVVLLVTIYHVQLIWKPANEQK